MIDWPQLRHAYGPATDVPALLARATTAPASREYTDEPWYTLWSSLCHQSDVYPASYAAVPELVAIAMARRSDEKAVAELLLLAGVIELERHRPESPPLPQFLEDSYSDAVRRGAALATECLPRAEDDDTQRRLDISLHCFEGRFTEARRLMGDEDDFE